MINMYSYPWLVDWEIPTDTEELCLALNDAIHKSCTVKLQFQCQSLYQATKHMNELNVLSCSLWVHLMEHLMMFLLLSTGITILHPQSVQPSITHNFV